MAPNLRRNGTHAQEPALPQHDSPRWIEQQVLELFALPFGDLIARSHQTLATHFDPNALQVSTLMSIKTGRCPENCSYCPQSAHYNTGLPYEPLSSLEEVVTAAKQAKAAGATRFCMGAAWRGPNDADLKRVVEMIQAVKALGLQTCATLGLLTCDQAKKLKQAGLDFYNHNIDTSEAFYQRIITTRTFAHRLQTLQYVRQAGIQVCCGGILGMGESVTDRAQMLLVLANLPKPPESVPINLLIRIPGTPLQDAVAVHPIDFVRTVAVARILMPTSYVRLSAGRESMSDEMQALCFFAGANSIFLGEKLLTASNALPPNDHELLDRLGMYPERAHTKTRSERHV